MAELDFAAFLGSILLTFVGVLHSFMTMASGQPLEKVILAESSVEKWSEEFDIECGSPTEDTCKNIPLDFSIKADIM